MHSKAGIFNLALGALLLVRRITDTDTDASNEAKVLNTHWDTAFQSSIADLDLDSCSTEVTLELIEVDPTDNWKYSYKYPTKCAFFRRIVSATTIDNRSTHIDKRITIRSGVKVILSNEEDAVAEIISSDVPLASLGASAGLAIAYRLAAMSAPLVVGKGAKTLIESIEKKYVVAKAEAQEQDRRENFSFADDDVISEFVEARTE
jgi:hypothetical protein